MLKRMPNLYYTQGPAFVPSGIFKPAFLIALSGDAVSSKKQFSSPTSTVTAGPSLFLEDKSIEIFREGQKPSIPPDQTADWIVRVSLTVRSAQAVKKPSMVISFPELQIKSEEIPLASFSNDTSNPTEVSATMKIPNGVPELWFPHNLGTPKLYNVTVTLQPSGVSFTTTTGFRTIVLIQEPYSQEEVEERGITPGDQFHFQINGKQFYSLGTNIIPFDPFYSRMTSDQVRWVLQSAVLSGQNMVIDLPSPKSNLPDYHYSASSLGRWHLPAF